VIVFATQRRIEHFVFLDVTPEVAHDYLTTLKHWCDWYPGTIAIEGQTEAPSNVGETFTEIVKTLGLLGKLHWITVESVRPLRFVIETKFVEMPLMRGARMRITYAFGPTPDASQPRTRFTRTFEYAVKGLASVLDRVYIHQHLKQKAALALTNLPGILVRATSRGPLSHAG
jgi:hypothetical protein